MEEIINKLFKEMIPVICEGIEEKDWQMIKQEYNRMLLNRYSKIDSKLNTEDYDNLYISLYDSELEEWNNMPPSIKKSILIPDAALENIINVSNKSYKFAENRLLKGTFISEAKADAYITKLNILLNEINDANKEVAKHSIKEATIDLMYASNQSNNVSNRIRHLI